MKRDRGNISGMSLEGEDWVGVSTVDVVESHVLVTRRRQVLFIRGYAQFVDLLQTSRRRGGGGGGG